MSFGITNAQTNSVQFSHWNVAQVRTIVVIENEADSPNIIDVVMTGGFNSTTGPDIQWSFQLQPKERMEVDLNAPGKPLCGYVTLTGIEVFFVQVVHIGLTKDNRSVTEQTFRSTDTPELVTPFGH